MTRLLDDRNMASKSSIAALHMDLGEILDNGKATFQYTSLNDQATTRGTFRSNAIDRDLYYDHTILVTGFPFYLRNFLTLVIRNLLFRKTSANYILRIQKRGFK
jgi:hypothetical protein